MKLLITDRSPFARKCRAVAHAKGLMTRLEVVETDIFGNPEEIRRINPLGKVPALVMGDGQLVIDSPVICEYFDVIGSGDDLIPADTKARFRVLHLVAVADGMLDSAVEIVLEKLRPQEKQYDGWIGKHHANLLRGVAYLQEAHLESLSRGDTIDMAKLTVAIMLDYITHRLGGIGHRVDWQSEAPELVSWLEQWLQHPSLKVSAPRAW